MDILDFIRSRLQEFKGEWSHIARLSGVSRTTIDKYSAREKLQFENGIIFASYFKRLYRVKEKRKIMEKKNIHFIE